MTDPQEFHRNRASFRWALGALADALDEFELPEPREIAVRDDSDRVHVIVAAHQSSAWCDELAGLSVESRVPLSPRLLGTHYDAVGRLGAVRIMVTWYDPSPREPDSVGALLALADTALVDPTNHAYAFVDGFHRELTLEERRNLSSLPATVDHLAVYDHVLTDEEIRRIHAATD